MVQSLLIPTDGCWCINGISSPKNRGWMASPYSSPRPLLPISRPSRSSAFVIDLLTWPLQPLPVADTLEPSAAPLCHITTHRALCRAQPLPQISSLAPPVSAVTPSHAACCPGRGFLSWESVPHPFPTPPLLPLYLLPSSATQLGKRCVGCFISQEQTPVPEDWVSLPFPQPTCY